MTKPLFDSRHSRGSCWIETLLRTSLRGLCPKQSIRITILFRWLLKPLWIASPTARNDGNGSLLIWIGSPRNDGTTFGSRYSKRSCPIEALLRTSLRGLCPKQSRRIIILFRGLLNFPGLLRFRLAMTGNGRFAFLDCFAFGSQ